MNTYLVTGAAGFIGANVCEQLLSSGSNVVAVDNLHPYYDVRLKNYRIQQLLRGGGGTLFGSRPLEGTRSGAFNFVQGDVEDPAFVEGLFAAHNFAAVFHLAARAGIRASLQAPQEYVNTNIGGTVNLLQCLRQAKSRRMVMASTSSVYAGCRSPFCEKDPADTPLSPYAATKRAAELIGHSFHINHRVDFSSLRYFTVYGPAGRPDMSPFRFIQWIDKGLPVKIYGDGMQKRDFTYVTDVARATVAASQLEGYQVINVGAGKQPVTLNQLIKCIERELGRVANKVYMPFSSADMLETSANIEKANALLGWTPSVDIDEGVRRVVKWYRENRDLAADIPCGPA